MSQKRWDRKKMIKNLTYQNVFRYQKKLELDILFRMTEFSFWIYLNFIRDNTPDGGMENNVRRRRYLHLSYCILQINSGHAHYFAQYQPSAMSLDIIVHKLPSKTYCASNQDTYTYLKIIGSLEILAHYCFEWVQN